MLYDLHRNVRARRVCLWADQWPDPWLRHPAFAAHGWSVQNMLEFCDEQDPDIPKPAQKPASVIFVLEQEMNEVRRLFTG
jgi:hypothetical protein